MESLANNVALREDPTFAKWCVAAAVTVACDVVAEPTTTENHHARWQLANEVLVNPDTVGARLRSLVGSNADVTAKGSTVEEIGSDLIIEKVRDFWDTIATIMYPG